MIDNFDLILLILPSLLINHVQSDPAVLPRVTNYNETEARILLNIAAGAYSSNPEACVKKALPEWQQWMLYSTENTICDVIDSSCSSYTIRSDIVKEIIVAFRGTKTKKQLFMEGWESMKPGKDFFGVGLVNRYFFRALNTIWPNVEPLLKDPVFRSYRVTFTGHSLGAALASLAAARTVIQNLRNGDEIKLVTFGQPRIGDYQFAMYHDAHIPYSFRLVHSADIVPHMPACKKNDSYPGADDDKSKPCLAENDGYPYHHGIEIWYPYGMGKGAEYHVCLGDPKDEDFDCSDSLTFDVNHYKLYIKDHRHYFDVRVPTYGKHGCVNVTNAEASSDDDALSADVPPTFASGAGSPFQAIKEGIANVISLFRNIKRYF